jgi:hypothetical protein
MWNAALYESAAGPWLTPTGTAASGEHLPQVSTAAPSTFATIRRRSRRQSGVNLTQRTTDAALGRHRAPRRGRASIAAQRDGSAADRGRAPRRGGATGRESSRRLDISCNSALHPADVARAEAVCPEDFDRVLAREALAEAARTSSPFRMRATRSFAIAALEAALAAPACANLLSEHHFR